MARARSSDPVRRWRPDRRPPVAPGRWDDAVGGRSPEHTDVGSARWRCRGWPSWFGIEMLIYEAVIETGECHAFAPTVQAQRRAPSRDRRNAPTQLAPRRDRWRVRGPAARRAACAPRSRNGRAPPAAIGSDPAGGDAHQRLAPLTVELAVVTGDLGHWVAIALARACSASSKGASQRGLAPATVAALPGHRVRPKFASQRQLADRHLLQIVVRLSRSSKLRAEKTNSSQRTPPSA